MAQVKIPVSIEGMETTGKETIGTGEVDSTTTVIEDSMKKGSTITEITQMSESMCIQCAVS